MMMCPLLAFLASLAAAPPAGPTTPLFPDAERIYNYCPSYVELAPGDRRIYYCANRDPGVIRDFIYARRGTLAAGRWSWGERVVALAPSAEGWDSVHVCDPEVVAGRFRDGEREYRWAMLYLGCDTLDCTHNQVGVAFAESPDGPWVKWPANPIVSYPHDRFWGVGQPSAVSLDQAGRLRLFYTRGDSRATTQRWRDVDLSDLRAPQVGPESTLPTAGLSERDGSRVWLNNASFAHDAKGDRFLMVRDRHPHEKDAPAYIASEVQVAAISAPRLGAEAAGARWEVLANIGPETSGLPRNHNAALLRDPYGRLPDPSRVEVAFSVSQLGKGSLWSYRIHAVEAKFR